MVSCHDEEQVKQESNKFLSRLVSKDTSRSNSSCRDRFLLYYGGASGAIPFVWESRPGTPKHSLLSHSDSLLPPLTPPPSYQPISRSKPKPRSTPRSKILFPSRRNKRTHSAASPSLSSASSSSSSWSSSSSSSPSYFKTNKPKSRSSSKRAIRYEEDYGSVSDLKRFNGCAPVGRVIKSAFMSLIGRSSSSSRQGARR